MFRARRTQRRGTSGSSRRSTERPRALGGMSSDTPSPCDSKQTKGHLPGKRSQLPIPDSVTVAVTLVSVPVTRPQFAPLPVKLFREQFGDLLVGGNAEPTVEATRRCALLSGQSGDVNAIDKNRRRSPASKLVWHARCRHIDILELHRQTQRCDAAAKGLPSVGVVRTVWEVEKLDPHRPPVYRAVLSRPGSLGRRNRGIPSKRIVTAVVT